MARDCLWRPCGRGGGRRGGRTATACLRGCICCRCGSSCSSCLSAMTLLAAGGGGRDGGGGGGSERTRGAAAAAFYGVCSISLNFLNKAVVSSYGFNHPFFIMVCQVGLQSNLLPSSPPILSPLTCSRKCNRALKF